jgi:hypothetical protein
MAAILRPEATLLARLVLLGKAAAPIIPGAENSEAGPSKRVGNSYQAACLTQAFTFDNMAAPDAKVVGRKKSKWTYSLLTDQNTRPRVTYEGRILDPSIGRRAGSV